MSYRRLFMGYLLLFASMFPMYGSQAAEISDAAALRGLTEGKGVFLIDFNDPAKTNFYLKIIKGTHGGMLRQGVKPDFVIVYIGPTVRFLTTAPGDDLALEHDEALKGIARTVKELRDMGIRQEICAIATRVFQVDNDTLLPGLSLVGDGFISLIGWQSQGYKLVPLF